MTETNATLTQPTTPFANPKCQVQEGGDNPNSTGHEFESLGKGHFICKECNSKFVKIYRFKNEKDKGAPTGFETAMFVTLHNYNKHYTEAIDEGGLRTFKPRFIDWKIAEETEKIEAKVPTTTLSVIDILNTAIIKQVIEKKGNWYIFDGVRFNGKRKLQNEISAIQLQNVQNKIQLDATT